VINTMKILGKAFVAVAVVAMFGCGDDETPTAPTPTTPATVTDTFTGTVNRNGAASHNFTLSTAGVVQATLKSLSPNPEIVVGFAVGTWSTSVCNVVLVRDRAVQSTVIYGNVNAASDLCVRVYDVGNVVEPVEYSIEVIHP
jgi:hypothetical protein